MIALIIMDVWKAVGMYILVFYSGIIELPEDSVGSGQNRRSVYLPDYYEGADPAAQAGLPDGADHLYYSLLQGVRFTGGTDRRRTGYGDDDAFHVYVQHGV